MNKKLEHDYSPQWNEEVTSNKYKVECNHCGKKQTVTEIKGSLYNVPCKKCGKENDFTIIEFL